MLRNATAFSPAMSPPALRGSEGKGGKEREREGRNGGVQGTWGGERGGGMENEVERHGEGESHMPYIPPPKSTDTLARQPCNEELQ